MPVHDFDFQRYVERRKGAAAAAEREGASYAYAGDLRLRRLLARARPVTLALEQAVKLWNATARAELVGTAVRVTERSYPRVATAAASAAARLHVALPPIFASVGAGLSVHAFGTADEPLVLLHAALCDELTEPELVFAVGSELGRIQNGGALLGTARYYLGRAPSGFVRWSVTPARAALDGWWRRAAITADRAGLLATRDLAVCASAIRRIERAASPEAATAPTDAGPGSDGKPGDLVGARVAALEVFARSSYYLGALGEPGGTSPEETDRRVAALLKGVP